MGTSERAYHPNRSILQFFIRRLNVDHEVAPYLPQLHHGKGRHHVEDEFGRRACLETSTSGQNFRTGYGTNHNLRTMTPGSFE